MDPQALVFVLLLAGFLLIAAEFFIPSGGVIALMCVGCFAASFYYAYQAWYETSPYYWWSYVGGFIVLVPAVILGGLRILLSTRFGDRVLLRGPDLADVTPYEKEMAALQEFVGMRGKTLSLMTPGGMVLVNGERLHATSEGLVIESGTPVEVYGVSGTRVLVRPVEPEADPSSIASDEGAEVDDTFPGPIDPWADGEDA